MLDRDGTVLSGSHSPEDFPEWLGFERKRRFGDFIVRGERYAGVLLGARIHPAPPSAVGSDVPVTIFFASSREELDDDLLDTFEFLIGSSLFVAILSGLLSVVAVRTGLQPIDALASELAGVDDRSLGRRFAEAPMPAELRSFASSFDALLDRVESAFERERRFSADAAHEMRTPVTILKASIQAALLLPPDPVADREALAALLDDTLRLEELCEALLLVGQARGGGDDEPGMTLVDLAGEIQDLVDFFQRGPRGQRAALAFECPEHEELLVRAEAVLARRLVGALLENALIHGGEGVSVVVSLRRGHGTLVVSVEDDGPGIPDSFAPRVFERFARADVSRARQAGGSGLGLAICRALARGMGGEIVWTPREPRGVRFEWRIALLPT